MDLLITIITKGTSLKALRDALNGLNAVRHTALSGAAYKAWARASSLTLCEMYEAAEACGIEGYEVTA